MLIYFHGGGLMLLDAEDFQPVCTALAAAADCIVVNVDYRLAPEHPFPQPLDDAFAVYQWCLEPRRRAGRRPDQDRGRGRQRRRLPRDGDLPRREAARRAPAGAPAADLSGRRRDEPLREHGHHRRVHRARTGHRDARRALRRSAPQPSGLADPRRGSPRPRAGVHPRSPGHDPFVDQGRAYAAVLRAAGVPVEYSCYQGTIHAFVTMGGAVERGQRRRRRGGSNRGAAPSPASLTLTPASVRPEERRRPGRAAPTACSRPRRPAPRRRPATCPGPT